MSFAGWLYAKLRGLDNTPQVPVLSDQSDAPPQDFTRRSLSRSDAVISEHRAEGYGPEGGPSPPDPHDPSVGNAESVLVEDPVVTYGRCTTSTTGAPTSGLSLSASYRQRLAVVAPALADSEDWSRDSLGRLTKTAEADVELADGRMTRLRVTAIFTGNEQEPFDISYMPISPLSKLEAKHV